MFLASGVSAIQYKGLEIKINTSIAEMYDDDNTTYAKEAKSGFNQLKALDIPEMP